ncbi:MAG: CHAT domain-containing protein [Nostoc sp.]|uniref:CHAT domain-containing protein n=1 Tax=Nostoc sp. TaxID=1180 RepID=UPI002FF771AE
MQLPLLRQMKRLLRFLGLGIGTTLLILVLSLISIPSNAQLIPVHRHPPDFAPPLFKGSGDLALFTQSNFPAQASQSTSSALDLVQQGKTDYQKGQLEQAVTLWQQAADAFAAQGDRLHQAMTLSYLAQAYQQLGRWDKANPAIAQSLQLLKQPNQVTTGDRLHILAEAQTIQGSLQLDQGQASDAFASWQLAANAFQQAGEQAGVVRSQINQSQALVTLGLYKRANNLLGSLYEKLPLEEPLHLAILLNYGETLRLVGYLQADLAQPQTSQPSQNSEAILKDALELAQKLQSPVDITKAQISLGNTYRAIYQQQKRLQPNPCPDPKVLADRRSQALQYYQQAAQETDSPTSKIQALSNQQSLLLAIQSDSESINSDNAQQTQQVLAIATQIQGQLDRLPLSRIALYAQIQLAHNLLQLDQISSKLKDSKASNQAAQLLEVAVKQAQTLGDRAAQSYALGYLGQAYAQQQQGNNALKLTAQALSLTTKALNLAKTINAPEIAYRWFWQLGRLERANNPERAIKNYNEAYNTLQLLRKDLAFDNSDLQFSFEEHPVEQAYREFADLLLQPQIGGAKELQETKEVDDTNLQKAREVMRSLQTTELQNFLQQPCAEASLQQLDNIMDKPNSPTAILSPIIFGDRIEVIVRLPNKKLFHYPPTYLSEATAKATINQFQRDLQESYTFDAVKDNGQKIYKWLIKPAEKQLESAQIKTIVFVLDEPFQNIPMTALYDGEHYLIEKYAVSVSLGLDLKNPNPLPKEDLKVLAASLTDPPNQRDDKFKFAKLTYVKGELDAIKNTTGVAVTLIQDKEFTRNFFNKKFNDSSFQIVHLATHGQFSSNPQDTFILTAASNSIAASNLLSNGKVRLKDFDEMFRTRELNRADAIELLILSACETASGDDRATLGIAGAAVKAGARSAIASLWSLDDESSQTFIETFYKSITQPQTSRAEALRQAQLALLQAQDGPYTHPRYWAPFLLIGNWLPIFSPI